MSRETLDFRKSCRGTTVGRTQMPYLASAIFASTVLCDPGCATIAIDRSWQIHADPASSDRFTVEQLGRLLCTSADT